MSTREEFTALAIKRAVNDLAAYPRDAVERLDAANFAKLINMELAGELTPTQAKVVLARMVELVEEHAD